MSAVGVKDLTVISGQDFFIVTNVEKLQSIVKHLWNLLRLDFLPCRCPAFSANWSSYFSQGAESHQWILTSSGAAQFFAVNFLTGLAGLWVAYWGYDKGRGHCSKGLHPRGIIILGKQTWVLVIVHFQSQPQTQGMASVCFSPLWLGWLQRCQWNDWATNLF